MFLCLECGALFENPRYYRDYHGECFGYPAYEEYNACPCCVGAFVETYECDGCGKWITDDYVELDDGSRYCEECYCVKSIGEDD